MPHTSINDNTASWFDYKEKKLEDFRIKAHETLALDGRGQLACLAPTRVNSSLTDERGPGIRFRATRED
jgi:peptide chain release factor 3